MEVVELQTLISVVQYVLRDLPYKERNAIMDEFLQMIQPMVEEV